MWEFSLYFEPNQINLIKDLSRHLKRYLKHAGGVILLLEDECCLLIAVKTMSNDFVRIYRYIYNYIVNIIYIYYKSQVLSKLNGEYFKNDIFELVVKQTLLCFDEDFDKSKICEQLTLGESLSLEGFYNFKLAHLREKWEQLIKIIEKNANLLNSYNVNLDLTKCLLNELNSNIDKVCLFVENKKYFLKTVDNKDINYKKINYSKKQNFRSLLVSLIKLSPKSIILCGSLNREDEKILNDFFADRL